MNFLVPACLDQGLLTGVGKRLSNVREKSVFIKIREVYLTDTASTGYVGFQSGAVSDEFIAGKKMHDRNHKVNHPWFSGTQSGDRDTLAPANRGSSRRGNRLHRHPPQR